MRNWVVFDWKVSVIWLLVLRREWCWNSVISSKTRFKYDCRWEVVAWTQEHHCVSLIGADHWVLFVVRGPTRVSCYHSRSWPWEWWSCSFVHHIYSSRYLILYVSKRIVWRVGHFHREAKHSVWECHRLCPQDLWPSWPWMRQVRGLCWPNKGMSRVHYIDSSTSRPHRFEPWRGFYWDSSLNHGERISWMNSLHF